MRRPLANVVINFVREAVFGVSERHFNYFTNIILTAVEACNRTGLRYCVLPLGIPFRFEDEQRESRCPFICSYRCCSLRLLFRSLLPCRPIPLNWSPAMPAA